MAKKELLASVPLFRHCTRRELGHIAKFATEVSVATGQVVVEEGAIGDSFFVIASGSASVTIGGREVARLGPGAFFGEIALLDGLPRTATVTAITRLVLYEVKRGDFGLFLEESPSMLRAILRAVSERLRAAEKAPLYVTSY